MISAPIINIITLILGLVLAGATRRNYISLSFTYSTRAISPSYDELNPIDIFY